MKVGDIVEYKDKEYYLYSIYKGDLCMIVRLRSGEITTVKHFKSAGFEWDETYLNANITNLPIEEIKPINKE